MFEQHPMFVICFFGFIAWWLWMWMDKDRRQSLKEMNEYMGNNQKAAGRALAKGAMTGWRIFKLFKK